MKPNDGFGDRLAEAREEACGIISGGRVTELERRGLCVVPRWMVSDARSFRDVQRLYRTLHRVLTVVDDVDERGEGGR